MSVVRILWLQQAFNCWISLLLYYKQCCNWGVWVFRTKPIWYHVLWYMGGNISKEYIVCIFKVTYILKNVMWSSNVLVPTYRTRGIRSHEIDRSIVLACVVNITSNKLQVNLISRTVWVILRDKYFNCRPLISRYSNCEKYNKHGQVASVVTRRPTKT